MKNKDLIERIVKYQKKWNIEIYNDMYSSDEEAIDDIQDKFENHPDFLFHDFALDVDYMRRKVSEIDNKKFVEQLTEIYNFMVELHILFYRQK